MRACLTLDAVIHSAAKHALRLRAAAAYCTAASARRTLPLGASVWTSFSASARINQVGYAGKEHIARALGVLAQHLIGKAQINLAHRIEPLQLRVAEPKLQASHVILELGEPSRAQNRDEGVTALPDPIDGHLRRRAPQLASHQLDVFRDGH